MDIDALHAKKRTAVRRPRATHTALYRAELTAAAAERQEHLDAERATIERIVRLLPGASAAGLTVVELAEITGLSRPTIYRWLEQGRHDQAIEDEREVFEHALAEASASIGYPAALYELARHLGADPGEIRARLVTLAPYLIEEFAALGPTAAVALIDLLAELPNNEKLVLSPLFQQAQSLDAVSASVAQPETEILLWAALGLLRILPQLGAEEQPS
jgi:transcriptional regulator with XRE-family HTH domain